MPQYTQTQLDALNNAIAMGVLSVMYGNKTVQYRSLDDMIRLRDLMAADLNPQKAGIRNRRRFGEFDKGL
jgi:hypothetical protein